MIKTNVCKHLLDFKNYSVADNKYQHVLNANESPYNIFEIIKDEVAIALSGYSPNLYPDPMAIDLRRALAKYSDVNINQIICGNGSDELIAMIFTTFIDSNDVVVSHAPTFDMYTIGTKIAKGNLVTITDNELFEIDVDSIIDAVNTNNAKLLFLCAPNNPTGYAIPKKEILRILDNTECIVVIDEAYYEFYGISCVDLTDKYSNIIILRTLSKAIGLAGLRVGYAIGSEEIIDWLYKVKQPYNLNSMSQLLGQLAVNHIDKITPLIKTIVDERIALYKSLKMINGLEVFPSTSNFLLVRSTQSEKLYKYLLDSDILVKYYGEHPLLKGCFRITIGNPKTNALVLDTIKEVFI